MGCYTRLAGGSYTCGAELVEVSILRIPELNIELTPADIFE